MAEQYIIAQAVKNYKDVFVINSLDYKKAYKELYQPKTTPSIIDVPNMKFIEICGSGNPNKEGGEYKQAVALLYAISYTIKMSKLGDNPINGYFEYVVPPLEGLWWNNDESGIDFSDKSKFCWVSMIRQPEFVTDESFSWACGEVETKKGLDSSKAKLTSFTEGLCVQCMHIGDFNDEPVTVEQIELYIKHNQLTNDISNTRRHHEIYLSDPRKSDISKMKTVLRIPIKK